MRLLVTFGYEKILFAPTAGLAAIIQGFEGAAVVEEVGPYGARKLQPKTDGTIELKLIADDAIELPDTTDADKKYLDMVVDLEQKKSDAEVKAYQLGREVDKLKKALAEATEKAAHLETVAA